MIGALVPLCVSHAESEPRVRNTFGEVGLLEMPAGHMAPDGQFGVTLGNVDIYQRYVLHFQAMPWLETSFRYSRTPYFGGDRVGYDRSFGAKLRLFNEIDDFADVSLGIRDILGTGVYSSEYLTASKKLGPIDLTAGVGWGRLADTANLINPIGKVISSYDSRIPPDKSGRVDVGQFFHGANMGVFGGFAWDTPVNGLRFIAEYSSDGYLREAGSAPQGLHVRTPINLGLHYQPLETLGISAGWFYGTTYGLSIDLSGDPQTQYSSALRVGPYLPPPVIRTPIEQQAAIAGLRKYHNERLAGKGPWTRPLTPAEQARQDLMSALISQAGRVRDIDVQNTSLLIDANLSTQPKQQCAVYAKIATAINPNLREIILNDSQSSKNAAVICTPPVKKHGTAAAASKPQMAQFEEERGKAVSDMGAQGLQVDGVWVGDSEVVVYFENYRYLNETEAMQRIVRVLMADMPPQIELFRLISTRFGVPQRQVQFARSVMERVIYLDASAPALGVDVLSRPAPMKNPVLDQAAEGHYPIFSWSLDPKLTQHVFDPDAPIQFMVYADLAAMVQIAPGLILSGEATGTIWSDYTFSRGSGSDLPHVRTDLLRYLDEGRYGMASLVLSYRTRIAPTVYVQARGGYLEDMFAGVGGEVIWRPEQSRFTFGANIYQLRKRNFDRQFGLQDYEVTTAQMSVYYQSPWYGLNYEVHAGRYLAGDYGATFQITRRFESGVEIGAWATFTNVPFSKFGEGSFDKGIIIHIPLQWGLPIYSQSAYDLHLASLTRDGGQRLAGDDALYYETRNASFGETADHLDDLGTE